MGCDRNGGEDWDGRGALGMEEEVKHFIRANEGTLVRGRG